MSSANDMTTISSDTRKVLEQGSKMLIGGEFVSALSGQELPAIDPSSGLRISSFPKAGIDDVNAAVSAAKAALESPSWADMPPAVREQLLNRLADLMEANATVLAELETLDVGQPIWMSRNLNVGGAIGSLRYFAGWAGKIHGETVPVSVPIPGSQYFGYTTHSPVGVVAAIVPWNVPVMLAIWKLAPALVAGCTVVLKPSEEASLSILYLAGLAQQAGIPAGVINVVTGLGPEVGAALVAHPDVAKVTFTGSTATGRSIARTAGENIKKVSVELGGKSPQLLFADANLDKAIPGIADAIFLNSGQICVAGSRLYVQKAIYGEVVERLAKHADQLKVGPGLNPSTQIGPLVSQAQKSKVLGFIQQGNGERVTKRELAGEAGFYVPPTVVCNLKQSDPVLRDEIFGPVLGVAAFEEEEEAVALANDSVYGLSACVWTSDISRAFRVISKIKSGKVAVNTEPLPYPGLPEGGVKASGFGRDLGKTSIESYYDPKSVLIRFD